MLRRRKASVNPISLIAFIHSGVVGWAMLVLQIGTFSSSDIGKLCLQMFTDVYNGEITAEVAVIKENFVRLVLLFYIQKDFSYLTVLSKSANLAFFPFPRCRSFTLYPLKECCLCRVNRVIENVCSVFPFLC